MNKKIQFTGSFGEYFIMSLGLLLLSVITFGLALPYYSYWNFKYFFTKLRVGDNNVVYTGHFMEYFLMSLGLLLLSVITFGLALPYWIYWSVKYFFSKLELKESNNTILHVDHTQKLAVDTKSNTDNLFE
jgi:uncharacterized membrane protein YjgN (DUF898 family)